MKFIMTAATMPRNFDAWFVGFVEGGEFEADSQEAAQDWLDDQCKLAGTDADPLYPANGPAALAAE